MTVTFSTSETCTPLVLLYSVDHPIRDKARVVFGDDTRQYTSNNLLRDGSIADAYTSDWIHHVRVQGLEPGSLYHYYCACASYAFEEDHVGVSDMRHLLLASITEEGLVKHKLNGGSFRTAPRPSAKGVINNAFIEFALCGDIGQTADSRSTLQHIAKRHDDGNGFAAIIHAGDLSYADGEQSRWDTWLELVEGIFSRRIPLLPSPGNHEIETDGVTKDIFVPYQTRFAMPEIRPFEMEPAMLTNATTPSVFIDGRYDWGNSFYATTYGPACILILNSYTASHVGSNQYQWLESELQAIDRRTTPWVFVVVHCPMYNTFAFHQNEAQTNEFKEAMEPLFVKYHVNLVFSGHEHAYMMTKNIAYGILNEDGPRYIIIGDGGNREGHGSYFNPGKAEEWVQKRDISSFGFGVVSILNSTHAEWNWIKNVDTMTTEVVHNMILTNRFSAGSGS
eukprot:CAMPEP_0196813154 /NCGR_PEP_ID=MMETSP1362-20130617/34111_1 /TAXON_ID=163516 /ORGANISM="Leptocylindrus danicus, Strain CCMP1856" /LENGTH=449 /DNA_ID=CAMNT_0042189209 /DNA_START=137 /DNA_END=1486 /DNA_ORIENTATION=+